MDWSRAACVFGWCAVDFISKQNVREDRALNESKFASAFVVFIENIGPRDVRRHQVGSELNPFERDIQDTGERADKKSFGQSGNTDQQTMPTGENRREQLLDHVFLSDDDFAQFLAHQCAMLAELLQELVEVSLLLIRQGTPFQMGVEINQFEQNILRE